VTSKSGDYGFASIGPDGEATPELLRPRGRSTASTTRPDASATVADEGDALDTSGQEREGEVMTVAFLYYKGFLVGNTTSTGPIAHVKMAAGSVDMAVVVLLGSDSTDYEYS
jgi:hypothetical protein